MILCPLTVTVFAFLYRCRGGFLPLGSTQAARVMYWATPIAAWGYAVIGWYGLLCGVMAFIGLLIPHGKYQAGCDLDSIVGMGVIGMVRLALILTPMVAVHSLVFLLVPLGFLSGLGYGAGWAFLNGRDWLIAKGGSEWGEVLTGAAYGLAFSLAGVMYG